MSTATVLKKRYPEQFNVAKLVELMGNSETEQQLQNGAAPEKIVSSWSEALASYDQVRRKYFLYR